VERHGFECVDNAFAKEAALAGIALACRREWQVVGRVHRLRHRIRSGTWLIVRGGLKNRQDLRWRHMRLVLIVGSEVAILADDQCCNSGSIGRCHRGALDVAVERARWCARGVRTRFERIRRRRGCGGRPRSD